MYVVVDGGEQWHCVGGELSPGHSALFHIYYCNMKKLSSGTHTVKWYIDGKPVISDMFMFTENLDWHKITKLPSVNEISAYTNPKNLRSPYRSVWLDIPNNVRYNEYMVDFKADYLPKGTYCSLANWYMDYSSIEAKYKKVEISGISAYAGFQNIHNGKKMAIMSFWDVFCTDYYGNVTTLRAKIKYPKNPEIGGEFGGEGTGVQCIDPFDWKAKHWYRMHIRCYDAECGTTFVEMWVCDLETGKYSLICRYDTCIRNSAFKGSVAVFLENYLTEYAGDIRTLEICNAKYLDEKTGKWHKITKGTVVPNNTDVITDYAGCYDCGVTDGRLWIMTTGVGKMRDIPKSFFVDLKNN